MKSRSAVFILLAAGLATLASADSEFVVATFDPDYNFQFGWQFIDGGQVLLYMSSMLSSPQGWIGIGFGSTMSDCDCIAGTIKADGQVQVWNLHCHGDGTPSNDTRNGAASNITVLNGTYTNGTLELYFQRPQDTGSSNDYVITEGNVTDYIWGLYHSSSDGFPQHDIYGGGTMNFALTQDALNVTQVRVYGSSYSLHGVAMSVGWCGLISVTVIFARYFKWTAVWAYIHAILGYAAILITIISGTLTFSMNERAYSTQHNEALYHSRLGLAICSLVIGQGIFGSAFRILNRTTITPYKLSVLRSIHFLVGWTLLITSYIQIWYGWDLYNGEEAGLYVVFAIIVVAYSILEAWRNFWFIYPWLSCRKTKRIMTHQEVLDELAADKKKGYAFCDELVLDVKHFAESHPGGMIFITDSFGEDLGKYINGCSSYGNGVLPYYHSQPARLIMERLSIGVLSYPNDFVAGRSGQPSYDETNWRLIGKTEVSESTLRLSFDHPNLYVAEPQGVKWIGKHFRISAKIGYETVYRYYSVVYCMGPRVLEEWRSEIKAAGLKLSEVDESKSIMCLAEDVEKLTNQKDSLTMIIKEYKPYGKISQFVCRMEFGQQVALKGPLGPGLALTETSTGVHVGFAGGTGVNTFLDLVHLLWRIETQQVRALDGFSLILYVSFRSWKDAYAIDLLRATAARCEGSRRFVLHLFVNESTEQGRMTPEILAKYAPCDIITTAWACGPPAFNRWGCEMLVAHGVPRSKIILL